MNLNELPIRRKVMAAIMLTSITVVILTVCAFVAYDLRTLRDSTVRNLSTLGRVVAANSSASLAFNNEKDARDVLVSLRAEPQILRAALYDERGRLFVVYPQDASTNQFPTTPETGGHRFERNRLLLYEEVSEKNARFGTLYLEADLRFFYDRLQLYALVAGLIILSSIIVALVLSNRLQRNVSDPILALAGTARRVSEWGDYSVRASKSSNDELGLLTDAFNQMLTRIQEQTVAIQENEARLRLALEASSTGVWDWNLEKGQLTWDKDTCRLFGLRPEDFHKTYEHFIDLVHPDHREAVDAAVKAALKEKKEFVAEFKALWPDGSVHEMLTRGSGFYNSIGHAIRMSGVVQDIGERKRSEEAVRRLAAIVESTDDAIIGKDLNGIVTSWNKAAERMFGYSAEEMMGKTIERIAAPEDVGLEERILEAVRKGETRFYETQRMRKDGTRLDVSLTISPLRNEKGEIVGASSISRDITAKKQSERDLQESRARLSGIIETAMDAIISVDADQRITLFNSAAERVFRCKAADAMGKSLSMFIPERFRHDHRQHLQEFGKTGTTSRAMGHLRPLSGVRATGEEFPIEASISHIEVAGQQIYTVILRDITERMQAQESLERQARVLREQAQMLDLANVMARDMNDRIILWNTGMEHMYGWLRTETLGRVSHQVLKTEFPRPMEEMRAQLMRDGQWEGEVRHLHKDGRIMHVTSHWVLHKDPQGNPIAILEINTDITERKMAEEKVMHLNAELENRVKERTAELIAANQELEAFTYSVAHDLRAPLRHIDAFTKIIFDDFADQIPDQARRFLENIRKGSQNMNHLVDDLLNLARVGRQELKRELAPLNPIVQEVVSDLTRETVSRHIEWRLQPLPQVEMDPGLIKQVFVNLLSNAVKYSRPRKETVIEVGLKHIGDETVIFVQDNGVGFSMKYANKLFGVFQRLHRADEFEGTGVGLATVERIIRKHGGRIWAESDVDKGATFYFTLVGLQEPALMEKSD